MNTFLWVAQALLAVVFLAHGLLFLFPPKAVRQACVVIKTRSRVVGHYPVCN